MADFVFVLILAAIVGSAGWYVHRQKKKGVKCVGCSGGCTCSAGCSGCNIE